MIDHSLTQYNSTQTYINSVAAPTMAAACLHLQSSFICERLRECDIMFAACENKDHPVSVAKVILTIKKRTRRTRSILSNSFRVCERDRKDAKCCAYDDEARKTYGPI